MKATYRSLYGLIESSWSSVGGVHVHNVTVPPNCVGVVRMPAGATTVWESGVVVTDVARDGGGKPLLVVGSGEWSFRAEEEGATGVGVKSDDEEETAVTCSSMSLFPPHRVSTKTPVHLWLAVPPALAAKDVALTVTAALDTGKTRQWSLNLTTLKMPWQRQLAATLDLAPLQNGRLLVTAELVVAGGSALTNSWKYELVETGVVGTRLLDGAFIDVIHWSQAEGKPFNEALRQMTSSEWAGQIADMAAVGIRTATIQALFLNDEYPSTPNRSCIGYPGVALYPSKVYPRSRANFSRANGVPPIISSEDASAFTDKSDKVEAILLSADEQNVTVFVGLGSYAWCV